MDSSDSRPFPRFTAWRWVQLALGAAIVVWIIVVVARVGWRHGIEVTLGWVREGGPWMFFVAMAVLPAVGFPLLPFTLAAGPAFAPIMGVGNVIACAVVAVVTNVAVSYGLAVRWLAPIAERRAWKLPRPTARLTFPFLLLLRVAPGLPFWMQSYYLGLIRAPFVPYMAVSSLVPALYISATILGSTAVLQGKKEMAWFSVAGVILVGTVLHVFRMRHVAEIEKSEAVADRL